MEQAESNPDSFRVFTTEGWFVQLGMAARGIACCSKCGTSDRIVVQVLAFKVPQFYVPFGFSSSQANRKFAANFKLKSIRVLVRCAGCSGPDLARKENQRRPDQASAPKHPEAIEKAQK